MEDKNIKKIKYKDETFALVFSKNIKAQGSRFLTPTKYPLQLGLLEHKERKFVPPHIHNDLHYEVNTTQEFLYIEKGKVDIVIFSREWKEIKKVTLTQGDFILFVNGGHSVDIHKESRILEIKQGPYPGDKKAKRYRK